MRNNSIDMVTAMTSVKVVIARNNFPLDKRPYFLNFPHRLVFRLIHLVEIVAHAGLFGVHIEFVIAVGCYLNGNILDHLKSVTL